MKKSMRKRLLVGLAMFVVALPAVQVCGQDKAQIITAFKQVITDGFAKENAGTGVDHARLDSRKVTTTIFFADRHRKKVCTADELNAHLRIVMRAGDKAKYACSHSMYPGTAEVTKWIRFYELPVTEYAFDVKTSDSLVTPYTGVLSFKRYIMETNGADSQEAALADAHFHISVVSAITVTFGFQDGAWKKLHQESNPVPVPR